VNVILIQECRFEEATLSRGDLTEVEWRIMKVLLPVELCGSTAGAVDIEELVRKSLRHAP
jgi:hypothetical protein